jgi:mRNA interferase MazF
MIFERFDIVVVPFPFTDRTSTIRRPALVLSECDPFGRETGQCLLAMITRTARSTWPHDVPLTDLASTGLRVAGVVRMKLFTLDASLVLRRIGVLGEGDQASVKSALEAHLGMG